MPIPITLPPATDLVRPGTEPPHAASGSSAIPGASAATLRTWTSAKLWRNLLLLWTAHSLVFAQTTMTLTGGGPTPASFGIALVQSFATWMPWVPFSLFIVWLVQRYPIERQRALRSIAMLCAGAGAVIVVKALYVLAINDVIGWYATAPSPERVLLASVFNNLLLYWLIVGAAHALLYSQRYWQRESEVASLRASLSEARLQALSAQLNPHFLFNTLNTVAELVHHDAAAADLMLANLSALLRRSLNGASNQEVPLREELATLKQYLSIQRVRFGTRLESAFDIEPDCLDAQVPFLVLQPLVENAIVHAIAPRIDGGCVHISARRERNRLLLRVSDDGTALTPQSAGTGIGLRNTIDRLNCLYGEAAALALERVAAGGTRVTLTLPFSTNARHAGGAQ
jgi:signal transduction histidine kinase